MEYFGILIYINVEDSIYREMVEKNIFAKFSNPVLWFWSLHLSLWHSELFIHNSGHNKDDSKYFEK